MCNTGEKTSIEQRSTFLLFLLIQPSSLQHRVPKRPSSLQVMLRPLSVGPLRQNERFLKPTVPDRERVRFSSIVFLSRSSIFRYRVRIHAVNLKARVFDDTTERRPVYPKQAPLLAFFLGSVKQLHFHPPLIVDAQDFSVGLLRIALLRILERNVIPFYVRHHRPRSSARSTHDWSAESFRRQK